MKGVCVLETYFDESKFYWTVNFTQIIGFKKKIQIRSFFCFIMIEFLEFIIIITIINNNEELKAKDRF